MFDIGFWELMLVALVALIVLGPDRIPKVARFVGRSYARLRAIMTEIKNEIEKESGGSSRGE